MAVHCACMIKLNTHISYLHNALPIPLPQIRYIYRHGLENKTTSLHCYIASVLNTNLRFGYAPQLLTQGQLHMDSSSVSCLTALTHFGPRGSKND